MKLSLTNVQDEFTIHKPARWIRHPLKFEMNLSFTNVQDEFTFD